MARVATSLCDDEEARTTLERLRWPHGPVCPRCANAGDAGGIYRIAANPETRVRAGLLECGACRKQFTVTVGTFFADVHLPLGAWLAAWRMAARPHGVGARELQIATGLPHYQTARGMLQRMKLSSGVPLSPVGRRAAVRLGVDLETALRHVLRAGSPLAPLVVAARAA